VRTGESTPTLHVSFVFAAKFISLIASSTNIDKAAYTKLYYCGKDSYLFYGDAHLAYSCLYAADNCHNLLALRYLRTLTQFTVSNKG
jgi:hypothetical protein